MKTVHGGKARTLIPFFAAWLALCGALASSCADGGSDADGDTQDKPLYSTEGKFIRDARGRALILRGINVAHNFLHDIEEEQAGAAREAFLHIARSGFNAVRLPTEWASIEPERDQYSEEYVAMVVRHIQYATDAGLYVLIDMHQDFFGVGFNGDGCPRYACDESLYAAFEPDGPPFSWYFSDEISECFDRFWRDQTLQARQHEAARKVASRVSGLPLIIGFDPINEPFPGTADYRDFDVNYMMPFHARFAASLSPTMPDRLFFFEPALTISVLMECDMPGPQGAFGGVFAPHYYNKSIELNAQWDGDEDEVRGIVEGFDAIAAGMGVPWALGELGGVTATPNLDQYLFALYDLMDEKMAGTFIWLYSKSNGGFGILDEATGTWHPHAKAVLRPAPGAVAGTPTTFSWDYANLAFSLAWDEDPKAGDTEILLPGWVSDAGFTFTLDGKSFEPGRDTIGGRLIIPGGKGGSRTAQMHVNAAFPY